MPINASPEYLSAEKEYLQAQTLEERVEKLKKMISLAPSHKGAEKLRAQLKKRLKNLQNLLKSKKPKKSLFKGIKKQGYQIVIIGKTNSGKSSLLSLLTNAKEKISEIPFTTTEPKVGVVNINDVSFQIIENPAIESAFYNKGLTNSADALIIIIKDIGNIKEIFEKLTKQFPNSKQIILYNYSDLNQKTKLESFFKTKKYNFLIINLKKPLLSEIQELKNKIFQTFDKIRIYTKEPEKPLEKVKKEKPMILPPESTIKDVAEKILKGFSKKVKQIRIWGPSSKFPGQIVSLKHKLKDLDVVEFKTK